MARANGLGFDVLLSKVGAAAGAPAGPAPKKRKKPQGRAATPQPRERRGSFMNTAKTPAPPYKRG